MKKMIGLIGGVVLTGTGLVLMASQAVSQVPTSAEVPSAPAGSPAGQAKAVPPAPIKEEEKPVREILASFVKSFAAGQAEPLASLFGEDAIVVDSGGNEARGKAAITEMYQGSFEENPGLKLEAEIQEIRFLTRDVARAEGRSRISTPNGDASEYSRFSALLTNRDGKWTVAEIREYPLPPEDVPSYERLKELEWMVGDWVDESGDNKVTSSIRWADNKSYLIRTHQVVIKEARAASGTMFIGWDPASGQIKSWLFDSEGGHGEGYWTQTDENTWVVKAQGVLRDGRPTSATQIHTLINKDAAKTSSIDRIIGGQLAPDIIDIVMVRKPPRPDVSTPVGKPAAAPGSK
ncbi:MAG: DUF4440 domain-containing protein [Planctomycetes bacterium SCN 63-9]|nr:MAG: DUF4440 domain-containing protein [Planctomycetes bacterium SCN 63-9]